MDKPEYLGSCHCGNITYRFGTHYALNELPLRSCNCSFCRRHGSLYTSDPKGYLKIDVNDTNEVRVYEFSTKVVHFVICSICGVMPLALTRIDSKLYAVVAANTLHEPPLGVPSVSDFSNESLDAAMQRRKQNWIGLVSPEGWPNNPLEPTSGSLRAPSSAQG